MTKLGLLVVKIQKAQLVAIPETTETEPALFSRNVDLVASEYCRIQGLRQALENTLVLIEICYKDVLLGIDVEFEPDREIENSHKVTLFLSVSGSIETILAAEKKYYDQMEKLLLPEKRIEFRVAYRIT